MDYCLSVRATLWTLPKELPEIHVVRSLLEPQTSAVVEIHRELCWEPFAENFNWCRHLLLAYLLVLLLLGCGLEPLPGQAPSVEVHEDVAQTLHVVAAALLDPEMRVDGGVPVTNNH